MAAGRKPPGSAPSSEGYFGGATFDSFDDDQEQAESLALDVHSDGPGFGAGPTMDDGGGDDFDSIERGVASAQNAAQMSVRPGAAKKWPTGVSPDSASLKIDGFAVTSAAGYGPKPGSIVAAPVYAFRVLKRKRELRDKIAALGQKLSDAERQRDGFLIAMVQDLRGKILMADEGARLFEPVVAAERLALERRHELAGTNAEYDRRVGEIDAEAKNLAQQADAKRKVVDQRRGELDGKQRIFERADAKRKRLFIELRGILDAAEKSGKPMNASQSARVQELEGDIAAQKPEVDAATQSVKEAQAALAQADNEARAVQKQERDLEGRRRALDDEFKKQVGERSEGAREAERQRDQAMADVGRAVLASKGRIVDVADQGRDVIHRADAAVADRTTELETFVRAMDSYDADAVKRGIALVVGVVLLLIVAVVLVAR